MSLAELYGGTPRRAREFMEQVRELRRAIGYDAENVINVALLAWAGAPRPQVEMIAESAGAMGFAGVHSSGMTGLAVRDLAEGHYGDAYEGLKTFVEDPFLQVTPLNLPDFVEAASRSGHVDEAAPHVERLEYLASANESPWADGAARRSRALLGDDAERHFRASIDALAAGPEIELARTQLVFGEWLRRARRRSDARDQLRLALSIFERIEASAFAERARNELQALGEQSTAASPSGTPDLTSQELTVARLAASGNTNAEIGATMFLSVNTVDYHLRKVFQKLGISSRRQLADHLAPTS